MNYFDEQDMYIRELSEEIALEISAISSSFEEADAIWADGLPEAEDKALITRAFKRTEEDQLFWGCELFDRSDYS